MLYLRFRLQIEYTEAPFLQPQGFMDFMLLLVLHLLLLCCTDTPFFILLPATILGSKRGRGTGILQTWFGYFCSYAFIDEGINFLSKRNEKCVYGKKLCYIYIFSLTFFFLEAKLFQNSEKTLEKKSSSKNVSFGSLRNFKLRVFIKCHTLEPQDSDDNNRKAYERMKK